MGFWQSRVLPRPRLAAGLVLTLCFALSFVTRGVVETFTTFVLPLGGAFGWDRTSLNSIYAIYAITGGVAAPAVGWLLDRFGAKRLYLAGAGLLVTAYLGASQGSALWQFQLCVGVLVGFAYATLGSVPHTVVLSRWYEGRLSSAMGVVQASNGLGIFLIVPLAQLLIDTYGWRTAYGSLAALAALPILPLILLKGGALERGAGPGDGPAAGEAAPAAAVADAGAAASPAGAHWTLGKAVGSVSFWCLVAMFFFTTLANFLVTPQMVPLFVASGLDPLEAATIYGVIGTLAMGGLLGYGWLADRIGVFRAATISYTGSVLGFAVLLAYLVTPHPALVWAFALLFGPSMGARFPMISKYAARLYAGPRFGRIFGTICLGLGLGTALGSLTGGVIHDLTGGYVWVAVFGLVTMVVAYCPFVVVRVRGLR